jgi:hypothetical protein
MRYSIIFILALSLLSGHNAKGQDQFYSTGEILENLFRRLTDTIPDDQKIAANDSIKLYVEKYAADDNVFSHRFSNLRFLGQITAPDSSLKIITWNLLFRNGTGKYFSYLIRKGNVGGNNKVFSLTADYSEKAVRTDTVYTQRDWYGALYYDVRPLDINNRKGWILLGLDYGNPLITRKIIEVLEFPSDNSMIFGKKWFDIQGRMAYRVVFEYSSTATMTLRFNSETSIVFDHLVPFSPEMVNNRQYYGPDYSYDSYNLVKGTWKLSVNVDVRNNQ